MDQSLDEIIGSSWGDGKADKSTGAGKGSKSKGTNGKGSGGSWEKSNSNGSSGRSLDMSLDDLVTARSSGGKGKSWDKDAGKGKSKSKGSAPSFSFSRDDGKGGKGFGKSGKSFGKGKDSWDFDDAGPRSSPSWMEHDNRGEEEEEEDFAPVRKGKGKGGNFNWSAGKGADNWSAGKGGEWRPPRPSFQDYSVYEEPWGQPPAWKGKGSGGKGLAEGIWARTFNPTRIAFAAPEAPSRGHAVGDGSSGSWRRVEQASSRPEANGRAVVAVKSSREPRLGYRATANGSDRNGERSSTTRSAPPSKRGREEDVAPRRRQQEASDDEEDDEEVSSEEEEVRPPPKAKARTSAAVKTEAKSTGPKTVKVTNIPKELKAADVREAFEAETGKISLCELSKGTCMITFKNSKDAQKAVATFDKGELNGKIISVSLHK
mmetsp:Transcript_90554/g.163389  ORF Transcript_90554/g.163389 Transcript_90554/m.163389 type:complete len:431 (-) Transcript_90554:457-1749(-)